MWRRRPGPRAFRNLRQLSTAIRRRITDEGDWSYASEWWGTESDGRIVLRHVKSMLSVGLASIACCDYNMKKVANGKETMRVLCIGHGGGSLPFFLASKLQGAMVDIVEIDPVVISASVQAMRFPAYSVMNPSGERAVSKPDIMDELWDTDSPFMKALSSWLHPDHGTVVVNLHSDCEVLNPDGSVLPFLSKFCR
ncbi:hypothetical protein ACLB2K_052910 [Fragaria x ananassa]